MSFGMSELINDGVDTLSSQKVLFGAAGVAGGLLISNQMELGLVPSLAVVLGMHFGGHYAAELMDLE